jgi:hypothetical protein
MLSFGKCPFLCVRTEAPRSTDTWADDTVSRLEVDDQFDLRGLLERQIGGLLACHSKAASGPAPYQRLDSD